jgi:predicted ATPase
MGITEITIGNFKGIGEKKSIKIRPFTLFIGPNSSGKSTCVHALTALSQTVKLPNNQKPLVLDDEFALVHLGRFIDVIHSKSYQDTICLGFTTNEVETESPFSKEKKIGKIICEFDFKSTKRTQEIVIEKAKIEINDIKYTIKHQTEDFLVNEMSTGKKINLTNFGFGTNIVPGKMEQTEYDVFFMLYQLMNNINSNLSSILYLGPFRQQPLRAYQTFSATPNEVGSMGEATISILANEVNQSRHREHITQISNWLEVLKLGKSLEISRFTGSDLFEIKIETDGNFVIADLGYGMSQVLPVLTQCSFAATGSTLLFEQPEIHLHPLASRGLTHVFIDIIKKKKCTTIIETHSREMISELQKCIQDGLIALEEIAVYKVFRKDAQSIIETIDINEEGEIFDLWEKGFSTTL